MMGRAGETTFPVEDITGFDKQTFVNTPEKVAGWDATATKNAISQMKYEFSSEAEALGADPSSIFIAEDSNTSRQGVTPSWPVFALRPNGSKVQLGRYSITNPETLRTHKLDTSAVSQRKTIEARNRRDTFFGKDVETSARTAIQTRARKDTDLAAREIVDVMNKFDPTGLPEHQPKGFDGTTIPKADIKAFNQRPRTLVEDIVKVGSEELFDVMETASVKFWEHIVTPVADTVSQGFSEVAQDMRDLKAFVFGDPMEAYGSTVVNEPAKAKQMYTDSQLENTAKDIKPMTPTGSSDPSTSKTDNAVSDVLEIARHNHVAPEQMLPFQQGKKHAMSIKPRDRTQAEAQFVEDVAQVEDKTGVSTPPSASDDMLGTELVERMQSTELGTSIYKSEGYFGLRYRDKIKKVVNGKLFPEGFLTVGIGWNIEPGIGNDERNEATVSWLNKVNSTGKQYTLQGLISGTQLLDPKDAVLVSERQMSESAVSAQGVIGSNYTKLEEMQKAVLTDMMFQLGQTSFRKFTSLITSSRGVKVPNKPGNPFNKISNPKLRAPLEILNSTAFKEQTPVRFMKHFVNWVNSDTSLSDKDVEFLKIEARNFVNKHKPKNVSNTNRTADVLIALDKIE